MLNSSNFVISRADAKDKAFHHCTVLFVIVLFLCIGQKDTWEPSRNICKSLQQTVESIQRLLVDTRKREERKTNMKRVSEILRKKSFHRINSAAEDTDGCAIEEENLQLCNTSTHFLFYSLILYNHFLNNVNVYLCLFGSPFPLSC